MTILNSIFLDLHSFLRWVLLFILVATIANSLIGWLQNRKYKKSDDQLSLFTMIGADVQLLIGLVLYFTSAFGYKLIQDSGMKEVMGNSMMRFFAVEHLVGMLVAILCIHIGRSSAKKAKTDRAKHKRTFWWFLIAFILIIMMIPWPTNPIFQSRGWF